MKVTPALVSFILALAGVEATKPAVHDGLLTLQDLLALQNGALLPDAVMDTVGTASISAAAARPTTEIPEGFIKDPSENDLPPLPGDHRCKIKSLPRSSCDPAACEDAGGACMQISLYCYTNVYVWGKDKAACVGCYCSR